MNLLSNQNTKLKKDGILHFSIPAYKSGSGAITCPGAKDCIKGCYARQGFHGMSWVKDAKERRLAATLKVDFITDMIDEIKRRKVKYLRIHDAGDFYSKAYLSDWFWVMNECTDTEFYAYTKMVPLLKPRERLFPDNFTAIYSFGGRWDDMIDVEKDHHAIVFKDHEQLRKSGYADATESDLVALKHRKVGLVYHGGRHLNWGRIGSV